MYKIDLTIDKKQQQKNALHCKKRGVKIPTFAQMRNPNLIPSSIKEELKSIGLWDIHPRNLFRISWQNEAKAQGGGYGDYNYLVLPSELTGVKAKIIILLGKWFPTGAHKVGATFGCLIPKLITGQFDPANHKAVWPSTGNFCRGGAYVAALLGCESVAILPENMSKERFEWLKTVAGEIIATPGCESNVKEIFDKCWELKRTRNNINIFNQFEELGNPLWHYQVTGPAMEQVAQKVLGSKDQLAGAVFCSGSAGTLGAGNYLRTAIPGIKVAAAEALQCPTLLNNGFGDHRIEGIGDKHVPWVHDIKNTDMVVAVDDEVAVRMLRLFNEEKGRELLKAQGVNPQLIERLDLLGISGLGNLTAAIKMAKYYELNENQGIVTVGTDSLQLYGSRLKELTDERGAYQERNSYMDWEMVQQISTDAMQELTYNDKKRVHNLKYFTWIEQQERELKELNAQWYDHENYWGGLFKQAEVMDQMIEEFNAQIDKA